MQEKGIDDRYGDSVPEDNPNIINWLKSLKGRVGCEVNFTTRKEWSEDEEKEYKFALSFSKDAYESCHNQKEYDEGKRVYNWLKSLRPQKQWKPSEEQIEALDFAAGIVPTEFNSKRKELKGLLEQLKKL